MPTRSRPLLVLDLDETLWYGSKTESSVAFQLRPYLGELLHAVSEYFDLAVWTSASQDWMTAGLEVIRRVTGFDLATASLFLWDRSRCTWKRTEVGEYEWRKPARKLRTKWISARYPRERILAVDDTPAKMGTGIWCAFQSGQETSRTMNCRGWAHT